MKKFSFNIMNHNLTRGEMRSVNGGNGGTSCKATCNDGSLIGVSGCSDKDVACAHHGGAASCKCDYPGPFDPPPYIGG